jgi:hypothetical protein
MLRKEITERSPLRVLEKSIDGGLGRGCTGVVVARTGVGKTAFLVGIGLDGLMRGRQVLHVSLEHSVDRALVFYEDIFADLAHRKALEDVWRVRLEMERNRRIHSYLDGSFTVEKLREALAFKREYSGFEPSKILIDGLDFQAIDTGVLDGLRQLAKEANAELWMTAVTHRDSETDARGIPAPVAGLSGSIDVILGMVHDGTNLHVNVLKDHDNPESSDLALALDPTTMLLVRK